MENYIMLDGKKIALTEEQVAQLRSAASSDNSVKPFNPCERTRDQLYYYLDSRGTNLLVSDGIQDDFDLFDNELYEDLANYFNDKDFAMHVALNQLLYRKLLQYAYNNNVIDTNPWDGITTHYYILQHYISEGCYSIVLGYTWSEVLPCTVYFKDSAAALHAIEDVVRPFKEEYPDFKIIWKNKEK